MYNSAFARLVDHCSEDVLIRLKYNSIDSEQYSEFLKNWIIDALAGKRFGQAFCDYFDLNKTTPLYYFTSRDTAETWIKLNYLKQ